MRLPAVLALLCLGLLPGPVLAQQIALGGIRADAGQHDRGDGDDDHHHHRAQKCSCQA